MDQDVERVGVALSSSYEVVGLYQGTVIHLDHVALGFPPRDTLLVDALQDTWPSVEGGSMCKQRTEEEEAAADEDRSVLPRTGPPQIENSLLKRDLGRRDQDEEADPVEGAQVQVLCTGVCDGTHVGQELSGHCQLDGPNLLPLNEEFWKIVQRDNKEQAPCCISTSAYIHFPAAHTATVKILTHNLTNCDLHLIFNPADKRHFCL